MPSSMPILHQSLQFIDVTVLLFAGLLVSGSDCPLSCLYCISRYNSLIVTVLLFAGFRKYRVQIALLQTYYTSVASSYWFLQFFASQVWLVSGSDCPLPCLYCICRFTLLIITVFLSVGFQQVLASDCLLFKAYRVNIAPYYLFTLKNTFHYRKLYDIRVFV